MVRYSDSLAGRSNIRDAHNLIHEGKVLELGCLTLAKNRIGVILGEGKLDDIRSDYLMAL